MIKIMLNGCNGKMGRFISEQVAQIENAEICCGIDINTTKLYDYEVYASLAEYPGKADVIIDFSHPSCFEGLMEYALKTKTAIVVATTGLTNEQKSLLEKYSSEIPVFFSANMSLGINLLIDLVKRATEVLGSGYDIEIIEKHHNQKIDAPSGTALAIADAISDTMVNPAEYVYDRHSVRKKRGKDEIGLHAVRGGTIVGDHTVIFAGHDEIIEVTHKAASREVFALGAIKAAFFLSGKTPGLYNMTDLVKEM